MNNIISIENASDIKKIFNDLECLENRCIDNNLGDATPAEVKDTMQELEDYITDFKSYRYDPDNTKVDIYSLIDEIDKLRENPESANFFNVDKIKIDVTDVMYNQWDMEMQSHAIHSINETYSIPEILIKELSNCHGVSDERNLVNIKEAERLCERMVMYAETGNIERASANDRKILADPETYFDMQHNDFQAQTLIKDFEDIFPEYVQCYLSGSKRERTKLRNEIQEKYVPMKETVNDIKDQVEHEFTVLSYDARYCDGLDNNSDLQELLKTLPDKDDRELVDDIIYQLERGHKVPNLTERVGEIVKSADKGAMMNLSYIDQDKLCMKILSEHQDVNRVAALIPDYNPMSPVIAKAQQIGQSVGQGTIAETLQTCLEIQVDNSPRIDENYSILTLSSTPEVKTESLASQINEQLAYFDQHDNVASAKACREVVAVYMDQNPEIAEKFKGLLDLDEKDKAPEHKEEQKKDKGLDIDM